MITWSSFPLFALLSLMLWLAGALSALMRSAGGRRLALWLTAAGVVVYAVFVGGLWHSLQRPPLRTLGETRLWYTLFMMLSGLVVYARWRYRWILLCSLLVGTVFMCINVFSPDTHDRSLMPALQSAWFVPHVTVYMFSYSIFGCAFLLSVAGLWQRTGRFLPPPTVSCSRATAFSRRACSRGASGPSRLGATIGLGTPRRRGR